MEIQLCGHCYEPIEDGQRCFAHTAKGPRYHQHCWQIVNADEIEADARIDRWHTGYFAKTRPTDPDELDGWLFRQDAPPVEVFERPEGYYHLPLGTFD